MSNFPFVDDPVLRSNLDLVFAHIVDLSTLSLSESYKDKTELVSSLRKTIIIHTASIIEALLLWKLKLIYKEKKIELSDEWKYIDIRTIHRISSSEEVIAGKRKKGKKEMERLDFVRITDLCCQCGLVNVDDELKKSIDKVRVLRNKLHIGSLPVVENEYTKKDLEFCFSVAKEVKALVSN